MLYVNKVILIGVVCNTPTLRHNGKSKKVTNFTLKTIEKWKDKKGHLKNQSKYHRIVAWGDEAAKITTFVKKDMIVEVLGKLNYHQTKDEEKIAEVKASMVEYKGFHNAKNKHLNTNKINSNWNVVLESTC